MCSSESNEHFAFLSRTIAVGAYGLRGAPMQKAFVRQGEDTLMQIEEVRS